MTTWDYKERNILDEGVDYNDASINYNSDEIQYGGSETAVWSHENKS